MRRALCLVLVAGLLVPAGAHAHARVEATEPAQGTTVKSAPERVSFRFSEPVEASFGALRVFDAQGQRVEQGAPERSPRGDEVSVGLKDGLADGTYVATFRVVSADSHPVSGGFAFDVGAPSEGAADVGSLIDEGSAGPVTEVAFGAVRALGYAAIALAVGGVAFILLVCVPVLQGAPGRRAAAAALAARATRLFALAVALGVATSLLAIAFQAATAAGESLWGALDPVTLGDVLGTRYGWVTGVRALVWVALGGVLLLAPARALVARRGLGGAALLAPLLGFLLVSPALSGHPSTQGASEILVPANVSHVGAMSVWVGGVAFLLLALPAATRALEPRERTRVLAASVARFSTVALVAVAVLLAGGIAQSIVELESLGDLLDTAFGRSILIKACAFLVLLGLGALARQRLRPALARLARTGEGPGATGVALRRALRAEVALFAVALAATAALVSYAPPSALSEGPFGATRTLGPARAEVTVDPAAVGRNELHIYLFDRRSGLQYDRAKEVRANLTLPERDVGPIRARLRTAGPGHYVSEGLALAPSGDWRLGLTVRVSAFDEYEARMAVPVE